MIHPIQWVANRINDLGFDLYEQQSLTGKGHYSINGQSLVIRVAYKSPDTDRWQWKIESRPKKSILILVAVDGDYAYYAYVIPWEIAKLRTRYAISSHPTRHAGMIAPFLNKWEIVSDVVTEREAVK